MKDKALFTPGPLTTSPTVKAAMLRDLGSRDGEFIALVQEIREQLLALGGVSSPDYEAIILQGSGTFGIESVISSVLPPDGKLLVIVNGAYGKRIVQMAQVLHIATHVLEVAENQRASLGDIEAILEADGAITHVVVVHCETTTGIVNPVEAIGELCHRYQKSYFVDAMSSFGGIPLKLDECNIDYLVSSANKCIQGVPGFSFALAKRASLLATEGYARSLSLDLLAQWRGLEANGQFRFTPPTHTLLAFRQALQELADEGSIDARAARYERNHLVLTEGMRKLGFAEYLPAADQGYIITSFLYPQHENFDFMDFYNRLSERGLAIYPGKVSNADCFRIGHIGHLFEEDMRALLAAIEAVVGEMGIR